ncbi:MAG: penicillin-binding protein 1A [Methylococcaceae bacterium]|nr:penicillin-binding protein 1A [Methylococcaceae bacterium]
MARSQKKHKPVSLFRRLTLLMLSLLLSVAMLGGMGAYALYRYLEPQLPDIDLLLDARYQIPMSVYSKDGRLIGQFGEKKRNPVGIADIPRQTLQAFLAAEDDRFFEHPGVDYQGLLRAVFEFLRTGEKKQGGSTITMQVARNFFLSSEKTLLRKVKEILLAIKIESRLPKEQILELYLNKIYFGHHAYGIEAAAQVYYGKSASQLSLAETAMIAGLPKAPSSFNPLADPERALTRRNYVLKRMLKLQFIDDAQFNTAMAEPVNASLHTPVIELDAPYVSEMVRAEMYQKYGEEAYSNGYKVYTTLDSRLQSAADKALKQALHEYDERHGYRGAKRRVDLKKLTNDKDWDEQLMSSPEVGNTIAGLVLSIKERSADVYLGHSGLIQLEWEGVRWARKYVNEDVQGPSPRAMKDVLKIGDIIRLRLTEDGKWALTQVPKVEGALVSLDPKNGAILAMSGGFDFNHSKFNRVTQAQRQPGSGFKPVLYASALDAGYTPASIINDAPIVFNDPSLAGGAWRPQNYSGRFYGPTRLREALVKSRNLVSIRLLREIGLDKAIETAKQFGFSETELPRSLSLALGSGTATPLRMAQVFSVFANGGFRVEPYLIERIETHDGGVVFQATPPLACRDCQTTENQPANLAPRAITPQVHFMMNSMLQDVVRFGTATQAMEIGREDLAGKTGTTNEQRDAWFNGYTPSLVAISWLGFDTPKPLGEGETGGHSALPMWIYYMQEALKNFPEIHFPLPEGLIEARISPSSGLLVRAGNPNGITEYFPPDLIPKRYSAQPKHHEPVYEGGSDEDMAPSSEGIDSASGSEPASPDSGGESSGKTVESLF